MAAPPPPAWSRNEWGGRRGANVSGTAPVGGGVLVVGSVSVDLTVVAEHLPGRALVSGGVLHRGHGAGREPGHRGGAGGSAVRFVGAVGHDADGDAVVAALTAGGIDVAGVARVGAPTGTALICVDAAGENQIAVRLAPTGGSPPRGRPHRRRGRGGPARGAGAGRRRRVRPGRAAGAGPC